MVVEGAAASRQNGLSRKAPEHPKKGPFVPQRTRVNRAAGGALCRSLHGERGGTRTLDPMIKSYGQAHRPTS
jgi:hypothetical protein